MDGLGVRINTVGVGRSARALKASLRFGPALGLALLAIGGCGSGHDNAGATDHTSTESGPTASLPLAPPSATGPATGASGATPGGTGGTGGTVAPGSARGGGAVAPEDQPGGAGDSEPIRVPARFTIRNGALSPRTVSVPAFLAIGLTIASADGRAHDYEVRTPGDPVRVHVPAGGSTSVVVPGIKAGSYNVVALDGGRGAILVVGGEPGP